MKKMKKSLVALAVAGALAMGAGQAQAFTATGNVTLTGTVIVACTVSSPTADFGPQVPTNTASVTQNVSLDINCGTGTPWNLSAPLSTTVLVGAVPNLASLVDTSNNTLISGSSTKGGTGTGAVQTIQVGVKLYGTTTNSGLISGTGALSGTVPLTLMY